MSDLIGYPDDIFNVSAINERYKGVSNSEYFQCGEERVQNGLNIKLERRAGYRTGTRKKILGQSI